MKIKSWLLFGTLCVLTLIVLTTVSFSRSPLTTVDLTTYPTVARIQPFEAEATSKQSPVVINLEPKSQDGKPLENAKIDLTILTPSKTPWFTTDFPIVEGTKLLEISSLAPSGKLKLEQTLPIRGTYQLLVKVTPDSSNSFTPFQQKLKLSVPENGIKYRNFAILATILLIIGLIGGSVIGRGQKIQAGEIAPRNVRLLLSGLIVTAIAMLLFVNISAEIAQSNMSMPMSHPVQHIAEADKLGLATSQGLQARISGDNMATVGTPVTLKLQVTNALTQQPGSDVMFDVKVTQIEHGWVAFAYQGVGDGQGKLQWQHQFFDGAPHKIEVEILPLPGGIEKFQPFKVQKQIEVEGVAPPLLTRLISLSYLAGIVLIGFLIGIKLQHKKISPTPSI
ncbi:MAG: hypothetical protein Cpurp_14850 [Chlorogloea purpurea SAG 13.99]|nr:hypothetical protein [Chlorogloea purpurea SAG 13.99]